MGSVLNFVNKYKVETALALLLLSWLSNPLFFSVLLALLIYYYAQSKSAKVHLHKVCKFYDYRAKV